MIDSAIRSALLGLVPELAARVREELGRPRMIDIQAGPVSRRAILAAERRGELAVYRPPGGGTKGEPGHASFVDELELFEWIRRHGSEREQAPEEPHDDVASIIEMGDRRRRRRAG